MIGYSILEPLFINVLQTKFVTEIYHSVLLKPTPEGGNKPVAPVNKRYIYVGLNDTKGFSCYCRQSGSGDVISNDRVGSCGPKIYRFQVPTKLVFFHDYEERIHDDIIGKLVQAVIKTDKVRFQKITMNPDEILRSEAPTGKFQFKESTFYVSLDFFILLDIQVDNCTTEIQCEGIQNPYCIAE